MSEDNIVDIKSKIRNIRELFIQQCREGIWSESKVIGYTNKYFKLGHERVDKHSQKWVIMFAEETLSLEDLDINYLYFKFILLRKVQKTAKNHEKFQRSIKLARVSDKFFEQHKDLKRDSKLDKLLES